MMQHHKYSLTELDDMIRGKEVYIKLLVNYLEEEKIRQERRK